MFSAPRPCYDGRSMRPRSTDDALSGADLAVDPLPDYAAVDLAPDDYSQPAPDFDAPPARPSSRKGARRPLPEAPAPAPPIVAPQPLTVCLLCGEGPDTLSDCAHPEVLHLAAATAPQRAAALRLAQLAQERRSQERALRRLVADALRTGEATVTHTAPPPSPVTPPSGADPEGPCPRCGHAPEGPARRRRGAATRPLGVTQGAFAFASPPESPAPQPATEAPHADAPPGCAEDAA